MLFACGPSTGAISSQPKLGETTMMWARAVVSRPFRGLRAWIGADWPFKAVAYPCREMSWETFAALNGAG